MNLTNATATIAKFSGDENNKSYVTLATGAEVMITPATNEIAALFPDLPVGQTFQFVMHGDDLIIPPESTFTITATDGEVAVNDVFVVRGAVKRQMILGQYVLKGLLVRTE